LVTMVTMATMVAMVTMATMVTMVTMDVMMWRKKWWCDAHCRCIRFESRPMDNKYSVIRNYDTDSDRSVSVLFEFEVCLENAMSFCWISPFFCSNNWYFWCLFQLRETLEKPRLAFNLSKSDF
jgi:hypothetical protein